MWKKFLATQTHLKTYVEEWNRSLFLTEAFLCIRNYMESGLAKNMAGQATISFIRLIFKFKTRHFFDAHDKKMPFKRVSKYICTLFSSASSKQDNRTWEWE